MHPPGIVKVLTAFSLCVGLISRWLKAHRVEYPSATETIKTCLSNLRLHRRHWQLVWEIFSRTDCLSALIHDGEFSSIPLYFLDSMTSHISSPAAMDLRTFICLSCPKKALIQPLSKFIIASHNSLLVPSMPIGHFDPLK